MKNLLFVGLDVDDNAFHATIIHSQTGETIYLKCRPNHAALSEKLLNYHSRAKDFSICYESTFLGFSLCRQLREEGFDCDVIASGLIPEIKGHKIKTDRCDSQRLASLYLKGMLTVLNIPDYEDEAERDLVRSRGLVLKQVVKTRNHIQALLRRHGIDYKKENKSFGLWTDKYRKWLYGKTNKLNKHLSLNLNLLLSQLEYLESSLKTYHAEIENLAKTQKYKEKVDALVAYRGIETLSAMKLITEIGDIRRFKHPRKLMSFLGFDVTEYSSGGKERKFGITKYGNKIARTTLVEATQRCATPPKVSYKLKHRRKETPVELTVIADKCMKRLYQKSHQLLAREKNRNKVKVACAREMCGFIWESLMRAS
jgi:transposase